VASAQVFLRMFPQPVAAAWREFDRFSTVTGSMIKQESGGFSHL
jgi:hypothetical protein